MVPITAGNVNNIIGRILRTIIRIVGRIIIVKIIIKPISTKLEREDKQMFTSSKETLLERISCRGKVEVLVAVLRIDNGFETSLFFDIETVQ